MDQGNHIGPVLLLPFRLDQFVYVDCDINDKLIVIKISPKIKVVLNKKVGLKFTSENIHFFSQNGNRIN